MQRWPSPPVGPPPATSPVPPRHLDESQLVGLVQPTDSSCGSAVLTVLDLARTGSLAGVGQPEFARLATERLRQTNSWQFGPGRWQFAWPRALGTRPAALRRVLEGAHVVRVVDPSDRARAYAALSAAVATRGPQVLYVGDASWMQHIVLVLAADAELRIYDPWVGGVLVRSRADFLEARLRVAGWDQPWLVVLPTQ